MPDAVCGAVSRGTFNTELSLFSRSLKHVRVGVGGGGERGKGSILRN